MQKFEHNLTANSSGALRPLSGAFVTVTDNANGLPATLYSDNGVTPLKQPLVTENTGYFGFYAADGKYTLTFSGPRFDTFTRQILLEDPEDNPALTRQEAALPNAASKFGFQQSGAGAVPRKVQDELRERVSVTQFGAKGDGATVDQAAIVTAVAAAYAAGSPLHWPAGAYVSDASIPNFHDVRHIGPGIVKRGSTTFAVNPTGKSAKANGIYIATTGSSTNDGLSATEPMATFQGAFDALKNYDLSAGNWSVIAAAGTYDGSAVQTFSQPSKNRVTIRGPVVGGHPNVPAAIIDGTGGDTYSHGLRATENTYVLFQDLKFINFTAGSGGTRIGCLGDTGSDVYTTNVHADSCDWAGLYVTDAILRMSGGIYENCQWGVAAYHSRANIGYNGSASANRPIIRNNTVAGVVWTGIAMGHIDYCDIQDNPVGVQLEYNSRAHVLRCNFKRNTYAIRAQSGAVYLENENEFNRGSVDANTVDVDRRAYSAEASESRLCYSEMRVAFDRNVYTHTGTAAKTVISAPYTLPAYRLCNTFQHMRVKIFGSCTSMTNGASLALDFDGVPAQALGFNGAPGAGAAFTAEFLVVPTSKTAQRVFGSLSHNLTAARQNNASAAIDMTTDKAVQISATLAAAGDTLTIHRVEVYLLG